MAARRRVLDDGGAAGADRFLDPKARPLGPVRQGGQGHLLRQGLEGVVAGVAPFRLRPQARRRRARGPPKSQSQFLRTVVVSPSKDLDQELERRKDLKRLFDLVVSEKTETPPEPKADWLATPRRQY